MKSMGIKTSRFTNAEVFDNIEKFFSEIKPELLQEDCSRVPPLGERGLEA
jgi:hypothetical protein